MSLWHTTGDEIWEVALTLTLLHREEGIQWREETWRRSLPRNTERLPSGRPISISSGMRSWLRLGPFRSTRTSSRCLCARPSKSRYSKLPTPALTTYGSPAGTVYRDSDEVHCPR